MEEKYCVYLHKNVANGKCYVGITKQKPSRRWREGKGYKGQIIFNNAIKKYGWNSFGHFILEENLDRETALCKEKHYIIFYNCLAPFGYNVTDGGENTLYTQEYKERISKARKGHMPTNLSHLHTAEIRDKISKTLTGRKNLSTSKKVFCEGKIFSSIGECSNYYSVELKTMSTWLTGKRKMPDEFFKKELRYNDVENFNYLPQTGCQKGKNHFAAKKVLCVTTQEVFPTISEASKKYGVPSSRIIEVCKGRRQYSGKLQNKEKLVWSYYEENQ